MIVIPSLLYLRQVVTVGQQVHRLAVNQQLQRLRYVLLHNPRPDAAYAVVD